MDEGCPTLGHFSVHERKLMKFRQYLAVFPSHFNNTFLKSHRLLTNLIRNCEILQDSWNDISQNFSNIILFIQLQCTLLTFSFTLGTFERWLQNFGFIQTDTKFWGFKLGNGES
jgi:hypothetical protein